MKFLRIGRDVLRDLQKRVRGLPGPVQALCTRLGEPSPELDHGPFMALWDVAGHELRVLK